jgi:predicted enzyme related to lactoylglutathione lyase
MPNPVVRWQILSPDPDQTAGFYEKLFEWKLTNANALGYRELSNKEERSIDGGVWPAPAADRSMVQLFIEVRDIDAVIRKAEKFGASVIVPKSVLPDGDAMAVLQDPIGLSFGVCQLNGASASP